MRTHCILVKFLRLGLNSHIIAPGGQNALSKTTWNFSISDLNINDFKMPQNVRLKLVNRGILGEFKNKYRLHLTIKLLKHATEFLSGGS